MSLRRCHVSLKSLKLLAAKLRARESICRPSHRPSRRQQNRQRTALMSRRQKIVMHVVG